jgi:hypothetical protein
LFEVVENLSAPVEEVLEATGEQALLSSKTNTSLDHPGWCTKQSPSDNP